MWIIIAITWGVAAAITCIFYPFWESRRHIGRILSRIASCAPSERQGEVASDAAKAVMPPSGAGDIVINAK
jgi:hypothetical protein